MSTYNSINKILFLVWSASALSKRQGPHIKKANTRQDKSSCEFWVRSVQQTPMQYISTVLICSSEWKVSPYCWSRHVIQIQVSEVSELELTWMPHLWRLNIMIPESDMEASKGEKQTTLLPSYNTIIHKDHHGIITISSDMYILMVTNSSQIRT